MEEEVNEICRAYVTDYWFDDVEKDVTDLLNSDEWETVPQSKICVRRPSNNKNVSSRFRLQFSRRSVDSRTARSAAVPLGSTTTATNSASVDHERFDRLSEK